MALFGRESEADQQRAQRATAWIHARPPGAILSVAFCAVSVVDCWTLLIGVAAGIAAVVLALRTLPAPGLPGRRLCMAGLVLGITGITASAVMMFIVYPWMAQT